MNPTDPQPENTDPDDDRIDDLLSRASWPEPSAASTRRLAATWASMSPARRRAPWPRRYFPAMAAAAVLLLTCTTALVLLSRRAGPTLAGRQTTEGSKARVPASQPQTSPPPPAPSPPLAPSPAGRRAAGLVTRVLHDAPRPPTLREQLAIRAELARPPRVVGRAAVTRVDAAVARAANGDADLASLGDELRAHVAAADLERRLAQLAEAGPGASRLAAVRLLSSVGASRSVPLLVAMLDDPDAADASLEALGRLAGEQTLADLAAARAADPAVARQLCSALLRRGTPEAMQSYLGLVVAADTRGSALAALDGLAEPPVEFLLGELSAPQVTRRLAAARALGRIDGPATTALLAERVARGGTGRREALAALLCSRGDEAAAYVADVRGSSHLAAVVRSVEVQLAHY